MSRTLRITAMVFIVALAAVTPSRVHAQTPPVARWHDCYQHLDWQTMTTVVRETCAAYPMGVHQWPVGHWTRCARQSPHVTHCVRWPTFYRQALTTAFTGSNGHTTWLPVTGYSWGCGASGPTADGSVPSVGTVASNIRALWHHTIYVPSLGYRGYVDDTGAPLDLFAASCAQTYAYTGWRQVIVY